MYLEYYGLQLKPFDLSLKPGFLWLGEKHAEALATLQYGVKEDLGFLLLTGNVGAGKTVIVRRLINNLDQGTIVAHIVDPGLAPTEFFKILATEFKLPGGFRDKAQFLTDFRNFLYRSHAKQKKVLLIVDEAQRLSDNLLDQIRVLSNIEKADQKLINIFFVGQPEFKNMLQTEANRPLRQRIAVNYHIDPLTKPEVAQYIAHRLKKAGCHRNLFNPDAIHEIFDFTKGYPRAINILCDHALLTGFTAGLATIDSNVIKECKVELKIRAEAEQKEAQEKQEDEAPAAAPEPVSRPLPVRPQKPRTSLFGGYSLIIGVCLLLSALFLYMLLRPNTSDTQLNEIEEQSAEVSTSSTQSLQYDQWRVEDKIAMERSLSSVQPSPNTLSDESSALPLASRSTADTTQPAVPDSSEPSAASGTTADVTQKDADTVDGAPREAAVETDALPQQSADAADGTPQESADVQGESPRESVDVEGESPQESADAVGGAPEEQATRADIKPIQAPPDNSVAEAAKSPETSARPTDESEMQADQEGDTERITVPDKSLKAMAVMSAAMAAKSQTETKPARPAKTTPAPTKAQPSASPPPPKQKPAAKPAPKTTVQPATPKRAKPVQKATPKPAPKPSTTVTAKAPQPAKQQSAAAKGRVTPIEEARPNTALTAAIAASQAKAPAAPSVADKTSQQAGRTNTAGPTTPKTTAVQQDNEGSAKEQAAFTTAVSVAKPASEQVDEAGLENRLRWFLKSYCVTYQKKDIDKFVKFFVPGATENGKPFESLIPKYKRNFENIETIQYRIDLNEFSYDDNKETILVEGDFSLQWLPRDRRWRENSGTISMALIDSGSSFLVKRLDYRGSR